MNSGFFSEVEKYVLPDLSNIIMGYINFESKLENKMRKHLLNHELEQRLIFLKYDIDKMTYNSKCKYIFKFTAICRISNLELNNLNFPRLIYVDSKKPVYNCGGFEYVF